MKCKACGTEAAEDAVYCTVCGVHLETGMRANGDSPDSAIYPLLTAANLFRMRGEWDAAEQKCIEVLRLYPNNATAHSLLGDVYASQGRWADAVKWYQLAVEIDPDNKGDQSKLEDARRHLAAGEGSLAVSGPGLLEPAGARRYGPLVQLMAVALLAFVVMGIIHFVWRGAKSSSSRPGAETAQQGAPLGEGAAPLPPSASQPAGAPPPSSASAPVQPDSQPTQPDLATAPPADAAAAENGPHHPQAGSPPATPQVPPSDMTEAEARMLARLQTELGNVLPNLGGTVTDVRWDPLRQSALATVQLPHVPNLAALADSALRGAYRVGQGLARYGVARFEVVVKAPVQAGSAPDIVLAAEAANASARQWSQDAISARPEALLTEFANVWWHPQLR